MSSIGPKSPDFVDRYVGGRIRTRRMLIGMSQEKLAELIGLTFQQVQKYERGMNRIGAGRLHRIGEVLAVDVGYFYEGLNRPGPRTTDSVQEFLQSADGLRIVRSFAQIRSREVRHQVACLIESLAGAEAG